MATHHILSLLLLAALITLVDQLGVSLTSLHIRRNFLLDVPLYSFLIGLLRLMLPWTRLYQDVGFFLLFRIVFLGGVFLPFIDLVLSSYGICQSKLLIRISQAKEIFSAYSA